MKGVALVTGTDHGLGLALTAGLLAEGWRVFAGRYAEDGSELDALRGRFPDALHVVPLDVRSIVSARDAARAVSATTDHVDLLINNAGVFSETAFRTIREPQDYEEMHRLYDVNALGALRVVEAFLPLVDRSALRRLCFVSSEAGSIARAGRTSWYGYCQSKAALNMATRLLFNHLRPDGYTFRVYHPGWIRSYMHGGKNRDADLEPEEAAVPALAYFLGERDDEDRLAMRDYRGDEWALVKGDAEMRTLVLCDDRWHPAATVRAGLAPLQDRGFAFDWIEHAGGWSAARMRACPVVVLTKMNHVSATDTSPWVTEEVESAFRDHVARGNGLLVLHSGSAGYEDLPVLRGLIGGVFTHHPPQCPVRVEPRANHPLAAGSAPFTLTDEHYFMAIDDDRADVFLTTESEHGTQPGGWTRTVDGGRVCVLTPGHNLDVWLHPSYQSLIHNALRWCAGTDSR